MSDWEDESETVAQVKKNTWDDEDLDDVKDDWENDSDEEKKPVAAPKPKKSWKQKEEEKKQKEQEEREAAEAAREPAETEAERIRREQQLAIEADMENMDDLFKGAKVSVNSSTVPLEKLSPRTKKDFESFGKRLAELITPRSKSRHYPTFVQELARELSLSMSDVEVRQVASTLTTLANQKQREAKEAQKKGKKANDKPSLAAGKGVDFDAFGAGDGGNTYDNDDDGDFM